MKEQLTFIEETDISLEIKILEIQKKMEKSSNGIKGLFKRVEEIRQNIEFLEGELEDLVKANLEKFGT